MFAGEGNVVDERLTIHLGMDLFVDAGSALYAPLDGTVHVVANNARPQDYGPLVILRHTTGDGAVRNSVRSAPAQKVCPAPVRMTADTSGSLADSSRYWSKPSRTPVFMELRRSGRLMVMVATLVLTS